MNELDLKDEYIDQTSKSFNKSLQRIEKDLFSQVDKIIGTYFGKDLDILKKATLINQIEQKLYSALDNSKYEDTITKYLLSFDELNDYQKRLHKATNGISLGKVPLNDIRKAQVNIVESNLLKSGLNTQFVEPIKEIMTRNILVGTNVSEAREILEKHIVGDDSLGILQKNIGQVANDTLRQYDGVINTEIKTRYNMTKIAYLGSIIQTSRGQCKHWTSFDFLTNEQLELEIPIAVRGGSLGGYSCSGMYDGTDVNNFLSYRGGYNCRHTATPIY